MKVVLQRVLQASVEVEGEVAGAIGPGLVVLTGIGHGDTKDTLLWMARKIAGLRIFSDDNGKMNLSVRDVGGSCLVISQFTLYGDCRKGFRPGFTSAAPPAEAKDSFQTFLTLLRDQQVPVETGVFQADMQVHLINDGPVTLTLERS